MNRRTWLQSLLAAAAGGVTAQMHAAPAAQPPQIEALQKNWRMLLAAGVNPPQTADKVRVANDEWRKRLDKMQYSVLREEGTERPGSSPLNGEKSAGVFACAGC